MPAVGAGAMTLQDIEREIEGLSRAEKAAVLQRLALEIADVWPAIESRPDVAGGAACLARTRIAVWVLESYRRLGWSDARILANYPTLRAIDLVQAWSYADAHRSEMDDAIATNEAA
jgi:uncharacterized protein (DUF433 family)